MPAAADVGLVIRFLEYHRHLGLLGYGCEKPINVDGAEAPRSLELLIGSQRLLAQEHYAVRRLCAGHGFHLGIGQGAQVDAENLRAAAAVGGVDFHYGFSPIHSARRTSGGSMPRIVVALPASPHGQGLPQS